MVLILFNTKAPNYYVCVRTYIHMCTYTYVCACALYMHYKLVTGVQRLRWADFWDQAWQSTRVLWWYSLPPCNKQLPRTHAGWPGERSFLCSPIKTTPHRCGQILHILAYAIFGIPQTKNIYTPIELTCIYMHMYNTTCTCTCTCTPA